MPEMSTIVPSITLEQEIEFRNHFKELGSVNGAAKIVGITNWQATKIIKWDRAMASKKQCSSIEQLPQKFVRVKSVYSNKSSEDYINEILSKP